jgi:outer membrane scaffolding protein for murein synthesis (MipA/OmpV family)
MRLPTASLLLAAAALPTTALQPSAQETRRPLLEAGVFVGGGLLPGYPATGRSDPRAVALPWVIYRGEILRSDERGLRGRVFRSGDLELTLNANGALGSQSDGGGVRGGMADLDPMGEIGPSLRWVAWRDTARLRRIVLETPVRAAFTTDFTRIRHRGLMDYWYQVKPAEARPGRPSYDAAGGYLGLRLQASYRLPVTDRIWLTVGGRVENFSGATNADSPLFRSEINATLIGGVSILLYRSAANVASGAEPFD